MDSEERRRNGVVGRAQPEPDPRRKQTSNSTALIVLGLILFVLGGLFTANGAGEGPGGLLFGILGVGLAVAGIVIRPRS